MKAEVVAAIEAVNECRRVVMNLYGGNLDHPALDHLGAAMTSLADVDRQQTTRNNAWGGRMTSASRPWTGLWAWLWRFQGGRWYRAYWRVWWWWKELPPSKRCRRCGHGLIRFHNIRESQCWRSPDCACRNPEEPF